MGAKYLGGGVPALANLAVNDHRTAGQFVESFAQVIHLGRQSFEPRRLRRHVLADLAQGKDLNALVYRAKWFPFGPLLALALCVLVIIGQDTELVLKGDFSWDRLVITYMGLPVFLGFYAYHKLRYKTHKVPLQQVDLRQDSH